MVIFSDAGRLTHNCRPWRAAPACLRRGRRPFLVQHAGTGRHPLRVAGAQEAVVAHRIAVLGVALEQVGHGLEAAMWMPRCAGAFARAELDGPEMVEQQEWIEVGERGSGEGATDDEPVAFDGALRS